MLIEIRCNKFKKSRLHFSSGLNVVLGDDNATNSIGKSTLLMVIDFVFGGDSFLKHNKDVVSELGDHQYEFCLRFEKKYYFKRNTASPSLILICDKNYETIEDQDIQSYRSFLHEKYSIPKHTTFRSFTSLFSRIWGKENYQVNKPLHSYLSDNNNNCVERIIQYFNMYDEIDSLVKNLSESKKKQEILNKAFSKQIVPKITKTQYIENEKEISLASEDIIEIRDNLQKFSLNIKEIVNKDVLKLKFLKDEYLEKKSDLENKLARINLNLNRTSYVNRKNFEGLLKFFPDVNTDKLENIDKFHNKLTKILKSDLKESKNAIEIQIKNIEEKIASVDLSIKEKLSMLDNPASLVDKILELSSRLQKYRNENKYYKTHVDLNTDIKDFVKDLKTEKESILIKIEQKINNEIFNISKVVFKPGFKSPKIKLQTNTYSYEVFEDTGTGKAFSSLLIFDLCMLNISALPFLIHDSILFKNVENQTISNLIKEYDKSPKQIIIAIDEAAKYDYETTKILFKNQVIQLTNESVLYIKDWREKNDPE